MTFIGFSVKDNGDLIDPVSKKIILKNLLTRNLLKGLRTQGVNFTNGGSNIQ